MPASSKKAKRSVQYFIEINETHVRMIRLGPDGSVIKAGSAAIQSVSRSDNKVYSNALADAIKEAAKDGAFGRVSGMPCEILTGGSNIIIRKFNWPPMPPAMLKSNAQVEMATFLTNSASQYTIGCKVLKSMTNPETNAVELDVMVAAIPSDTVHAMLAAVKKCGFKAIRVDVRENVRSRMISKCVSTSQIDSKSLPNASYAVFDVSSFQVNVSIYLNGMFYSNRYFSPTEGKLTDGADGSTGYTEYDAHKLSSEISSIIDYIHYKERGSEIKWMFLVGDDNRIDDLWQTLNDDLGIPVYKMKDWLIPDALGKSVGNQEPFLSVYGLSLPIPPSSGDDPYAGNDMDLMPTGPSGSSQSASLLPVGATAVAVAALLAVGILIPSVRLSSLKKEEGQLASELQIHTITEEDMEKLNSDITQLNSMISEVYGFEGEYPGAVQVFPMLNEQLNFSDFSPNFINELNAYNGTIDIVGVTNDFDQIAENLNDLREHELIKNVRDYVADSYSGINYGMKVVEIINDARNSTYEFGETETVAEYKMAIALNKDMWKPTGGADDVEEQE